MKVDGTVWAEDAINALYSSLFNTAYHYSDMGSGKTVYSLNENFKDVINGAMEGIPELAAERGKETTDEYANSFLDEENTQNAQNSAKTFTEKVLDPIKTSIGDKPYELGKQVGTGFRNGMLSMTKPLSDAANDCPTL